MECTRCGKCCLADIAAYVTEEDRIRWEQEGRRDILQALEETPMIWAGDRLVSVTGSLQERCRFLEFHREKTGCGIYESRPLVCQSFEAGSSPLCSIYGRKLFPENKKR